MTIHEAPTPHETALTVSVPQAGRLLGIGRGSAYERARRGEIPAIRLGKRLVVSRAAIEQMLGLNVRGDVAATETTPFEEDSGVDAIRPR